MWRREPRTLQWTCKLQTFVIQGANHPVSATSVSQSFYRAVPQRSVTSKNTLQMGSEWLIFRIMFFSDTLEKARYSRLWGRTGTLYGIQSSKKIFLLANYMQWQAVLLEQYVLPSLWWVTATHQIMMIRHYGTFSTPVFHSKAAWHQPCTQWSSIRKNFSTMTYVVAMKIKRTRISEVRTTTSDISDIFSLKKARHNLSHHFQELHGRTRKILHEDGTLPYIWSLPMLTPLQFVDEDGTVTFRLAASQIWLCCRQPFTLALAEDETL